MQGIRCHAVRGSGCVVAYLGAPVGSKGQEAAQIAEMVLGALKQLRGRHRNLLLDLLLSLLRVLKFLASIACMSRYISSRTMCLHWNCIKQAIDSVYFRLSPEQTCNSASSGLNCLCRFSSALSSSDSPEASSSSDTAGSTSSSSSILASSWISIPGTASTCGMPNAAEPHSTWQPRQGCMSLLTGFRLA